MKLTLGFSPCPNDTFIFEAMVHGRINTEGLEFDYFLTDVEELNRRAFTGSVDITKMSVHAYAYASKHYLILDSGSALGHKNGPLLISKHKIPDSRIPEVTIAIPGKHTTANLLLSVAWPEALDRKEYLFSEIEDAILNDEVGAGLIIHESRFTYQAKGLHKIADLGDYWEKNTGLPIPLGVIAINRNISHETAMKVNRIIRRSLEYAYNDSLASYDFVADNAREMDMDVMNKHIKLYVNKFTMNLGNTGKRAIGELLQVAVKKGVIPDLKEPIFLIQP